MSKMRVMAGQELLYPDGSFRGGPGYIVNPDLPGEANALLGQMEKFERCGSYRSADERDESLVMEPWPEPKKKAKKKAAKKK